LLTAKFLFLLPCLVSAAIAEVFSRIDHKFDLMYAKVIENNVQKHTKALKRPFVL